MDFSLGGMVTRRFAQNEPRWTERLIILNSPHKRTQKAKTAILARVEQARKCGAKVTVEVALERWFTPNFKLSEREVLDLVWSWVLANKTNVYHEIYRVLAVGIDEIAAPEPAISRPTLVVTEIRVLEMVLKCLMQSEQKFQVHRCVYLKG